MEIYYTQYKTVLTPLTKPKKSFGRFWHLLLIILLLVSVFASAYSLYAAQPPANFPTQELVVIPPGTTLTAIADQLHADGYIRSKTLFIAAVVIRGEVSNVKAGEYHFAEPQTMSNIIDQLVNGDYNGNLVRLTHFEGQRVVQLAQRASEHLKDFSSTAFVELALLHEGQLFPDTYYIPPDYSEELLVDLMRKRYDEIMTPLRPAIAQHTLDENEVIILASILEREANTSETKQMVSGILQNRLSIGMPLQADASIEYELDKPLSDLVASDLEIDSPYNTYLYPGLPPTPIGNPGLTAITAVLEPADTNYLYYITGTDGVFHYAEDFDTHRSNIQTYLRQP